MFHNSMTRALLTILSTASLVACAQGGGQSTQAPEKQNKTRTVSGALTAEDADIAAKTSDGETILGEVDENTGEFSIELPADVAAILSVHVDGQIKKLAFLKSETFEDVIPAELLTFEIPETDFAEALDMGVVDLSGLDDVVVIGDDEGEKSVFECVDFDADGDWDDAGEQALTNAPLASGTHELSFTVPDSAAVGSEVFARFRLSSQTGLSYAGPASDGEVEDYQVVIDGYDFGDAPYGDARHVVTSNVYLGFEIDAEAAGQPNADATGDDADGGDDEDGVTIPTLVQGQAATVRVEIGGNGGFVLGWIDWNGNGVWGDEANELVLSRSSAGGSLEVSVTPPADAVAGGVRAWG